MSASLVDAVVAAFRAEGMTGQIEDIERFARAAVEAMQQEPHLSDKAQAMVTSMQIMGDLPSPEPSASEVEAVVRREDCAVCEKCGNVQAEVNWCQKCGYRTTVPAWAEPLIRAWDEKVEREGGDDVTQGEDHEPCPTCGRRFGNINAPHLIPGGDGSTWCVPQGEDHIPTAFEVHMQPSLAHKRREGLERLAQGKDHEER